jgi:hypothetical protein
MQNISNDDLLSVSGGAGLGGLCTTGNPLGQAPKAPQQSFENSHSGPSANDRIMSSTNTLTSRGSSMLGDGRPSMPSDW